MGVVLILGEQDLVEPIAREHLAGMNVRHVRGFDVAAERILVGCVVVCARNVTNGVLPAVQRIRSRYPLSRIILVTDLTPDAVASLHSEPELLKQVVWLTSVQDQLRKRIEACMGGHFLERATEAVLTLRDLPPPVARFLEVVWTVPRPPSTVKRASGEAHSSPSTFRDQWRGVIRSADPKEFVDWAVLGRAVTELERAPSWATVAHRLGVHRRTLDRISRRRLGVSLDQVQKHGAPWVAVRFDQWLSRVLAQRETTS